jgi:acyl-CoA synthetase (AMP-forming)/AMP-acid ligase II
MAAPVALDIPTLLAGLAQRGERRALSFYRGKALDGRLTYGELAARVEALAGGLHERFGLSPGDRVAILAPNRLEVPVLVLALLRLGAVVVPLNPGSATEDWTYILAHSGARGLCATRELLERVPQAARTGFALHVEDAFSVTGRAPEPPSGLAEQMAVVLYTSGTTGNPKGVALRQRNLISNAWSMARNFRLDATTQYAVLPLYHAHAFGFGLMTALSTGGHLVFSERLEPFTWASVVRAEAVEVSSVVPSLIPMLLAAGVTQKAVPTLRHLMVSSAPLQVDVARTFEARSEIPLIQGWGLSEYTNFACCVSPFEPEEEHRRLMYSWEVPSIGPALEGTEVQVQDAQGRAVEEGTRGELAVRGHSVMLEYFRDPANTSNTIDGRGWLHTGDEGFFRMHGGRPIHFVTGRLKEIIIRDAEKYSPLRLEQRLLETLPELSGRLVVLGFPHREHGEEVGAYLEIESCDDALRGRLTGAIAAMPVAERPKVLLYGARPIPRTHTGKIQRRKLQPWFTAWVEHRGQTVIAELPAGQPVNS